MAKKRYLTVNLVGSKSFKLLQPDLEKMYTEFNLPFPDINKAILSKEFRKAVNTYGITLTNIDEKNLGVQTYIPPHEIKSMVFVIADYNMRECDILEEQRKRQYADI